jgi:uncharacterized protein YjbI with pentapeptide repeats
MERRRADSAEVVQKLRRGEPVAGVSVAVLELTGRFEHAVSLRDCEVGRLQTRDAFFLADADFGGTTFLREVALLNVTFEGRTSFAGCCFRGEVDACAHFVGQVSFARASFMESAEFSSSRFAAAEFPAADFRGRVAFTRAVFGGWAEFGAARFRQPAGFRGVEFKSGAGFCEVRFERSADFTAVACNGECGFVEAQFLGFADFDGARMGRADLRDTVFAGQVQFRHAQVQAGHFDRAVLSGQAGRPGGHEQAAGDEARPAGEGRLPASAFDGPADAGEVQEGGLCDFSATAFGTASFAGATFGKGLFRGTTFAGDVSFAGSVFSSEADLGAAQFHGRVSFQAAAIESIVIAWPQIEGRIRSACERDWAAARDEFGLLKRLFERRHAYDDMDEAYRMFKRCERRTRRGLLAAVLRPFDALILDLGAGYGTCPWNITALVAVLVLLFAGVYYLFSDQILVGAEPSGLRTFGFYLYYSLVTFMTIGAENIHPDYQNLLKYAVSLEGFCGFFLMTLFVATFTRKVIR